MSTDLLIPPSAPGITFPATPLDPAPTDFQDAQPSAGPVVDGTDAQTGPATSTEPEAPKPDAWKDDFKNTYGFDAGGYSTKDDAFQALKDITERFALAGLNQKAPIVDDFPTVQPPAAKTEPEFDENDPTLSPEIKKLLAANKVLQEQIRQREIAAEQAQAQYDARVRQEVLTRAVGAVDKLASPKYGVGATRTYTQQKALQALLQTADDIYKGMLVAGQQVPTIETIMNLAVRHDGGAPAPAKQEIPTVHQPDAQISALITNGLDRQSNGAGYKPNAQAALQHKQERVRNTVDSFKKDPQYMAAMKAIANRR